MSVLKAEMGEVSDMYCGQIFLPAAMVRAFRGGRDFHITDITSSLACVEASLLQFTHEQLYRVAAINPEFLKYIFKITQHN
jgi:hypothetical protein